MRIIDAHSFQKTIREYRDSYPNAPTRQAVCNIFLSMLGDENQTPTIDPESLRPQGEWIDKGEVGLPDVHRYQCSNCKTEELMFSYRKADYCPNCGARKRPIQSPTVT